MTSSNGNIFRVTGHLCGEFTGPRWISHTKASDAELWCFLWSAWGRWFETLSHPLWRQCNDEDPVPWYIYALLNSDVLTVNYGLLKQKNIRLKSLLLLSVKIVSILGQIMIKLWNMPWGSRLFECSSRSLYGVLWRVYTRENNAVFRLAETTWSRAASSCVSPLFWWWYQDLPGKLSGLSHVGIMTSYIHAQITINSDCHTRLFSTIRHHVSVKINTDQLLSRFAHNCLINQIDTSITKMPMQLRLWHFSILKHALYLPLSSHHSGIFSVVIFFYELLLRLLSAYIRKIWKSWSWTLPTAHTICQIQTPGDCMA